LQLIVVVVVVIIIIIIIIVLMFLAFVRIETSVFSRSQSLCRSQSSDDPQQVCVVAKVAMIHNKFVS
jgi:FtsZ-interacting cell division protein ZipA